MNTIQWPEVIRGLIDSGLTQPQLATGAGCGQSTISDLLNGKTTDPRTSTGLALIRMARARGARDLLADLVGSATAGLRGAWEMDAEEPLPVALLAASSDAPAPMEAVDSPASAMLHGGRREADHVSDFGVLDNNGQTLIEHVDAIAKLTGDVPKRGGRDES